MRAKKGLSTHIKLKRNVPTRFKDLINVTFKRQFPSFKEDLALIRVLIEIMNETFK